ncbi:hypothetical protein PPACK8108_LOCUS5153 [Phakopsora pachyrhizi]|uniref:Uncharacterized protein n=1 Tax=Phakopsora pachyrhizi TaxID=170000 RepID=A0AAV0APQ6_PHAPC|nr:hypothetical protein PPACK8108_LOCUS5153 [Phakopsora pachyrhizi]
MKVKDLLHTLSAVVNQSWISSQTSFILDSASEWTRIRTNRADLGLREQQQIWLKSLPNGLKAAPPPTPPPPKNLQFSLSLSATITNLEKFRVAIDEHLDKTKVSIVLKNGAVLIGKASCTFLNLVSIFEKNIENNLLTHSSNSLGCKPDGAGMIGWGDRVDRRLQTEIAGEEDDSNRRQDNLLEVAIALTLSQQSLQSYLKSSKQKLTFKPVDISKLQKFSERAETTNEYGIRYLFGTTGTKSKKLRGIGEPKRQIQSAKWLWSCKDLDDDLKAASVSPGERIASSKHWMRGQGTLLEESSQNSNLRRNKGKYEMTDEYEEEGGGGSIGQCDRWCRWAGFGGDRGYLRLSTAQSKFSPIHKGMDRVNGKRKDESGDWCTTVKRPYGQIYFLGLWRSWPRTPLRMGMMEEAQQLLCSSKRQSQALGVGWQA